MATTVAELAAILTVDATQAQNAIDGFVRSFGAVNGAFGGVNDAMKGFEKGINGIGLSFSSLTPLMATAATGIAGAIGIIGKAAFDAAVEFDNASDHIRIITGAMGNSLANLEGSFRTVFTSIPTSAEAASQAIGFLSARLHLTGQDLENLAETELELARITGSALGPQLESTTRLFGDWAIATQDQTKSLDLLLKVSQATAINVTDLSQRMVQFGAPLRELGFSFEQAAILIGKFQAEGVELNKALPGLRLALNEMANKGVKDAGTAFEFLIQKIKDTKDPMKAIAEAAAIFGKKAGPDMAEAIKQGRFSLEELTKTIAANQDTIRQAAADTEDFGEKWTILKNKVTDNLEPLGKVVFDTLTAIVSTFTDKGDEIEKRWSILWKDLNTGTRAGTDGILTQIISAKSPFFDAGHDLADAIHDGFFEGLKKLGLDFNVQSWAQEHVPAMPKLSGGPTGTFAIDDATINSWKQAADAAKGLGFAVGGVEKPARNTRKSLEDLFDTNKKGAGAARQMFDEFKSGAAGLDQAFAVIVKNQDKLSGLFDVMGKAGRKASQELVAGLKAGAAGLTDFFKEVGANVKVSVEKLAANFEKFKPSIDLASALAHIKEAINDINVDRAVAGLETFDSSIKIVGRTIEISISTLEALRAKFPAIVDAALKAGFQFKAIFPGMTENINEFSDAINKIVPAGATEKITIFGTTMTRTFLNVNEVIEQSEVQMDKFAEANKKAFEKILEEVPHWAGAIVDAAAKVKKAMEDSAEVVRVKAQIEMHNDFKSIVDDLVTLGEQAGLTGDALIQFVQNGVNKLGPALKEGAQRALEDFLKEFYKLPGALDEIFNKIAVGAKRQLSGLFEVINSIPGKFGDSLRKTTNTITQWINDIDGILKGLHKIFNQVPEGLAAVFGSIFKKATQGITEGTKDLADALGESVSSVLSSLGGKVTQGTKDLADALGESVESVLGSIGKGGDKAGSSFLSGFMGKVGLIGSGIATFFASRGANGAVTPASIAGAALAGAQIGAAFGGPFGAAIGAAIGTAIGGFHSKSKLVRFFTGGIFSLIFGGPSDEQKAAEEKAKKEAEAHVEQVTMEVLHTAFDAMQSALELFEKIADFTKVPTKAIKRFFNQLEFLLQEFVELSKSFTADMATSAKAFAESIGPIVDVIGNSVDAFEKLGSFTGVAQASIDSFGSAMTRVLQSFIAVKNTFLDAEGFIDATVNQARKFAQKIGGVIEVVKSALDAFAGFSNFKSVMPETLDAFAAALKLAIQKVGEIAESIDKGMVKNAARFADRAKSVVAIFTDGVTGFVALKDLAPIPTEAFEIFFTALKEAVLRMEQLVEEIPTDPLTRAEAIAQKSIAIFNAIKAVMDVMSNAQEGLKMPDFSSLKQFMAGAIQAVVDVANSFAESAVSAAAQFSDSASKVVSFFGAAGSTLKGLDGIFATQFDFGFVKEATKAMIQIVIDLANEMDSKGVEAAAKFATATQAVVTFMNSTATAFKALKEAGAVTTQMVIDLVAGFKLLVQRLAQMAQDLGPDGIEQATTLAGQLNIILGAITNMAATMDAIAKTQWPEQSAWTAFVNSIRSMVGALSESLTEITAGESLSAQIRDAAASLAANVAAAASSLASAASSALSAAGENLTSASQAPALAGGGNITSTGMAFLHAGETVIPAAQVSQGGRAGGGGDTYNITLNVQGSLIEQSRLEDAVVRALVSAQRSGRRITGL